MNISEKIQFATLVITFLVAIATFISTIVTYYMLNLAARPTLKVEATAIYITPDIKVTKNSELIILEDCRYSLNINLNVSNIGSNPAQDICIDGEVIFKKLRPFNYKSLPIHLPKYLNILEQQIMEEKVVKTILSFDNYVAKQIIQDYVNNKSVGIPLLPNKKEFKKRDLWHSPKIKVKVYYSDIQNRNYCSEIELFFHGYENKGTSNLDFYFMNMFDLNFARVKRISSLKRKWLVNNIRHKRHISFFGEEFPKNELLKIVVKK